jgi:hypothetical protein
MSTHRDIPVNCIVLHPSRLRGYAIPILLAWCTGTLLNVGMCTILDLLELGLVFHSESPEPGAVTFLGDVLTGGQSAKSEVGEGDPSDCCHHQPSTFIFDDEKVPPSATDRRVVCYSYYSYIQDVPETKR